MSAPAWDTGEFHARSSETGVDITTKRNAGRPSSGGGRDGRAGDDDGSGGANGVFVNGGGSTGKTDVR